MSEKKFKKNFPIFVELVIFLILASIIAIPFAGMLGDELYASILKGNGIFLGFAIGLSTGILLIFALWSVFKFNRLEKRIIELQDKLNRE